VVGVLIRMKLALLRNSMSGSRAFWVGTGGAVGALIATGTIVLSLVRAGHPSVVPDLLGTLYLTLYVGWIVGPIWAGSALLRAEHFAMLAIPRQRLAVGLLATAFVGIAPAVTLLMLLSMITYATRLGVVPMLVAVLVVMLQLACVVLLSRIATTGLTKVARVRTGAALNGVLLAIVLVLSQSGWMILVGLVASGVLEDGFPTGFSTALRVSPSGWGLVAVEASAEGSWWLVLGAIAGMAALIAVLLAVWARELGQPRSGHAVIRGSWQAPPPRRFATGRTGAVLRKELRTWWRDPARTSAISGPVAWGLVTALLPLTFGATLLLPWAALLTALMAATFMANLYAYDGTALWLTLHTGTEREDLRARQYAYLLVFTPITVAVAVGFTAWSGLTWAWPWVLALLPALLGGGVGLVALFSVVALAPGPDPHVRAENPLDSSDDIGPAFVVFFAGLLPPLPPVAVLIVGTVADDPLLRWAAVPVGIATGAFLAWWLGRLAYRRLQANGPELLFLMRAGRPSDTAGSASEPGGPEPNAMIQTLGWVVGSIVLFPQGLVPVVLKLTGNTDVTVWFLAMHLSEPWGWATAVGMVGLGTYLYYLAIHGLRHPTSKSEVAAVDAADA
jgi:hypothetical protein